MRTLTIGLVAVLVLLGGVGGTVVAHGDDQSGHDHDEVPDNETAEEWADWMEQHMIDHMGAEAVEHMQAHMGMSFEEMGEHMSHMDDSHQEHEHGSGMGCH